jgi:LytS/YehU family sensor histidine kinase
MRAAVHSATAALLYLRTGLAHDSARQSIVHLKALTHAPCVMFVDETEILTVVGEWCDAFSNRRAIADVVSTSAGGPSSCRAAGGRTG